LSFGCARGAGIARLRLPALNFRAAKVTPGRGAALAEKRMGFLLKSVICIALVIVALHLRDADAPTAPREAVGPRAIRAATPAPPRRPAFEEAARGLARAGVDALAERARARGLEAPRDCALALQRLQSAGRP
jgi:hypothetical protein